MSQWDDVSKDDLKKEEDIFPLYVLFNTLSIFFAFKAQTPSQTKESKEILKELRKLSPKYDRLEKKVASLH